MPVARATRAAATRPDQQGRAGPVIAVAVALALLITLIVVLIMQSDIGGGGAAGPTLDVPAVVGVPYGQAEAALKSLGFTVQRVDQNEPTQPPDVVLGQSPEAGRKIEKGGLLTLHGEQPHHPHAQRRRARPATPPARPWPPRTSRPPSSSRTAISLRERS